MSNSTKPWSSICKLNDTPRGARTVPRHCQKTEKWSGDLIWEYVCNFRRVIRVWAQTACRANSQSGKHYPWKPKCPWRNATNRWTSSRHCVPVTCPCGFTEGCCCCTCCRKHGRWRPEYLERLNIIQCFPPVDQLFSGCPPEDCRGNTVGPYGAQEKSMKQEQRGQGTTFERMR